MANLRHWSLIRPARVIIGALQDHPVKCRGVVTSLWKEKLGIDCCDESLPEAVQSPACLDPLLDDELFWHEGEALALRPLEVELEKGLAFFLDFGIVLAKANPKLERVDFLIDTLLITVHIPKARP